MAISWHHSLYTPLESHKGELRLLHIHKQNHHAASLECDIRTFELCNAPHFDALSYVWGDPSLAKKIQFCGFSRQITANLFDALTRLRDRHKNEWIWVDALCINQDDATEKNHQVPLMRRIYRSAETVFSWLGQADTDTHLAFSLIERWGDKILSTNPTMETWNDPSARTNVAERIVQPFERYAWEALITFTKKPYWERVWILQEVTLARQCILLCGNHELLFDKLIWAYRAWVTGNLRLPLLSDLATSAGEGTQFNVFMNIPLERGAFVKAKVDPSAQHELRELPFVLKRATILSATDPRDKVYGVLGLLDLAGPKIPVDYDSDVASAYRDTLLTLAHEAGRLDLLSFAGNLGSTTKHLTAPAWPSWVPDFTCPEKRDMVYRFAESSLHYNILYFNASGDSVAQCSVDTTDPRLLHVRGILLTEISALVRPVASYDPEERLSSWLAFTVQHAATIKPRAISPLQLLFRIMIADHLWRGVESPDCLTPELEVVFFRFAAGFLLAIRKTLDDECSPELDEEDTLSPPPPSTLSPEIRQALTTCLYDDAQHDGCEPSEERLIQVRNFLNQLHLQWPDSVDVNNNSFEHQFDRLSEFHQVFTRTAPRCLFITVDGHLGAGPASAKIGDKIFVPLGCSVPLVIRTRGKNFEVVSDAYVGGIMQGELFSGKGDGLVDLTDLILQ